MLRIRSLPKISRKPPSALALNDVLRAVSQQPRAAGPDPLTQPSPAPVKAPSDVSTGLGLSQQASDALIRQAEQWASGGLTEIERRRRILEDARSLFPEMTQESLAKRREVVRRGNELCVNVEEGRADMPRLRLSIESPILVAILIDDLSKGAGHKYLARIPTGKPSPKYRYVYQYPSRKKLTSEDRLISGAKVKVEHQGKEGHFEVVEHHKDKGVVTLKHDESGKTANVKVSDLHRMVESYHKRKGTAEKREKRRVKRMSAKSGAEYVARIPDRRGSEPRRQDKSKGKPPKLSSVAMGDISKYEGIAGVYADQQSAERAAHAAGGGLEYAVIPQPAGVALVYREPASGSSAPGERNGSPTDVFIRDSGGQGVSALDGEYVVMESEKVIPSHTLGGTAKHPNYPENVQERRYHELPGEQQKIERIASNLHPAIVANTNPDCVNGSPVVTEDGVVLGGNGRTMGLQLAYAKHPESAKKYREYLAANAHVFGLSSSDINGMKQPILVRKIQAGKDTDELRMLGRRMNQALTQGLDPRTAEVANAKNFVDDHLMDTLVGSMGSDQSLADFLHSPSSVAFVGALERAGIIDRFNKDEYVVPQDPEKPDPLAGMLNEDGRAMVERTLAAKFIPDAQLLTKMRQDVRQNFAASVPYLLRARRAGWDLTEPIKSAAGAELAYRREREEERRKGKKLSPDQWLKRGMLAGIDDDSPEARMRQDPISQMVFRVMLEHNGSQKTPAGFREFARRAERAERDRGESQANLFGDGPEPETAEKALDNAFGITDEGKKGVAQRKEQAHAQTERYAEAMGITLDEAKEAIKRQEKEKKDSAKAAKAAAQKQRAKPQEQQSSMFAMSSQYYDLFKALATENTVPVMDAISRHVTRVVRQKATTAAATGNPLRIDAGALKREILSGVVGMTPGDEELGRALATVRIDQDSVDDMISGMMKRYGVKSTMIKSNYPQLRITLGKSGGPYIGPRGGKWADPNHTIPWSDKEPTRRTVAKPDEERSDAWKERVKGLGLTKVPPPGTDPKTIKVDLSGDVNTHAVLSWRDKRGKLQQSYTQEFHRRNAAEKWARVERMAQKRDKVLSDARSILRSGSEREKDAAAIVLIIGQTGLRPGSETSARGDRYGVSTLQSDHVEVSGDTVRFSFIGKSGKHNTAELKDAEIAKLVSERKKSGGPLFSASREDARKISAEHGVKLKDFRTFVATKTATEALASLPAPPPLPKDKGSAKKLIQDVVASVSKKVADLLNNTPAVAKASYIHPNVLESWLDSIGAEAVLAKGFATPSVLGKSVQVESVDDDDEVEYYPYPEKYKDLFDDVDLNKSLSISTTPQWVELSYVMGHALWSMLLHKGANHKYIRRVPTGNPKRPWRYYYNVGHGAGLGHESEFQVGSKFKVAGGHYEVTERKGDRVSLKHDETGEEFEGTTGELKALLHRHHAEAIDTKRQKLKRDLAAVAKHGSEKQKARLQREADKFGGVFGGVGGESGIGDDGKKILDRMLNDSEYAKYSAGKDAQTEYDNRLFQLSESTGLKLSDYVVGRDATGGVARYNKWTVDTTAKGIQRAIGDDPGKKKIDDFKSIAVEAAFKANNGEYTRGELSEDLESRISRMKKIVSVGAKPWAVEIREAVDFIKTEVQNYGEYRDERPADIRSLDAFESHFFGGVGGGSKHGMTPSGRRTKKTLESDKRLAEDARKVSSLVPRGAGSYDDPEIQRLATSMQSSINALVLGKESGKNMTHGQLESLRDDIKNSMKIISDSLSRSVVGEDKKETKPPTESESPAMPRSDNRPVIRDLSNVSRKEFGQEMRRRAELNLGVSGNTYPFKDQIKKLGGVWDRYDKRWLMPDAESRRKVYDMMAGPRPAEKKISQSSSSKKTPSEKQVNYAMKLIRKLGSTGWHDSDLGQDMSSPPTRAEVERMTASEVSYLIDSLRGEF